MANLPEELVVEIMSWLPPESLIQFKCVSKNWYFLINSLIKDPNFVSKHLHNADNNILASRCTVFSCLKIYQTPVYNYKELFSLLSLSGGGGGGGSGNDKIRCFAEDLDLPIIPGEKDMSCITARHCNGVICLADYYRTMVLCNPAMKKSRVLPKPNLVDRFVLQGVGFGYDSRADDYKVVRFGREMSVYPRAEVYSLSSDSWKEIKIDSGTDYFPSLHIEVYFNGAFYWLMSGPRSMIRVFDMSDEVFRDVPLPDGVRTDKAHWTSLVVWNGSVALFLCEGEKGVPSSIEVWVMNDCVGGIKGAYSWSKKLAIGPFEGIDCPLGFWNGDDILMRSTNFKEIVFYNIHTQNLRNVSVDGVDGIGCRAFSYVKSLVSV